MIKRIALILVCVVLVALARSTYLIGVGFGFWQPFTRPAGVSGRARFGSSLKTAAWFDCSIDQTRDVNICSAWDSNGKLIAFGDYRLDGENRAATAHELRPTDVQLYPGRPDLVWIYLRGDDGSGRGRTLVPVNQGGQPLERFEVRIGSDGR